MDYATARQHMIDSQIRTNKVTDTRIIEAFNTLPRERFLPADKRAVAYADDDLALGGGRYLMEPMVLARLVQVAQIQPSDMVLVVGAATGYSAAVVSRLAATVAALESDAAFIHQAQQLLGALSIDNVLLLEGRLADGYPKHAPYDAILFDGAIEVLPQAIVDQLAEGGRLVGVMLDGGVSRAVLVTKSGGHVSQRRLFDAAIKPLPGFSRSPGFVF